jgi:hypothetical protein
MVRRGSIVEQRGTFDAKNRLAARDAAESTVARQEIVRGRSRKNSPSGIEP